MTIVEIEKTIPRGLEIIAATAGGAKHQDYKRVTELAELYHKVITGDGIETLLRQFTRREDEVMFEQRKLITQSITPAVCQPAMLPFYKVSRVNNITDKIDFESGKDVERKQKDLQKAIDNYYGEDSLDTYMAGRFVELSFSDPNAFIVTEFMDAERDSNNNPISQFKPYPIEYSSEQCVNFEYQNNTLQWLVVCTADKKMADKNRYVLYMKENSISFTPVDDKLYPSIPAGTYADVVFDNEINPVYKAAGNNAYLVKVHNHMAKQVPAKRVGYKRDLVTKSRTFVSPIEPGMPYLMKSISSNSEMDLSMKLHAFLQKFAYEQRCTYDGCNKGQAVEGGECKNCRGTGVNPVHTTAQDVITVPIPRDVKDMYPLSNLVHYPQLQVELLKFQSEFVDGLSPKFYKSVFNSDVFDKTTITATATEKNISMESVYDTLYPFAVQYASTRTYQLKCIANYLDIDDLIPTYVFPKDLRFRTREQLLSEINQADKAPGYIKNELSKELAEILLIDSPDERKRMRVKEKFYPFGDKTTAEIIFIISSDKTDEYNAVLWSNFNIIFDRAESAANKESQDQYLYDMVPEKIKTYIDKEVAALMAQIQPQQAETFGNP